MAATFDPAKDAADIAKHGVSLSFGERIFEDPNVIFVETTRVQDGERRFRAIGLVMRSFGLWSTRSGVRRSA